MKKAPNLSVALMCAVAVAGCGRAELTEKQKEDLAWQKWRADQTDPGGRWTVRFADGVCGMEQSIKPDGKLFFPHDCTDLVVNEIRKTPEGAKRLEYLERENIPLQVRACFDAPVEKPAPSAKADSAPTP